MSAAKLEVRIKDRKVNEVGLSSGKSLTIGRRDDNGLVLDLPTISLLHARIDEEGDEWVLTDLGSSNGVSVNGDRVKRRKLKAGDEVGIGLYTLCFASDASAKNASKYEYISTAQASNEKQNEASFQLEILNKEGNQVENVLDIDSQVSIGRDPSCDLILEGDLTVSEKHLIIEKIPQGWLVKNLNRSNVTWLNKIPIRDQAPLQPGDVLNVGNSCFRFSSSELVAAKTDTNSSKKLFGFDLGREKNKKHSPEISKDQSKGKISKPNFKSTLAIFSGPEGRRPRIIALGGSLFLVLLSMIMFNGNEKPNNIEINDVTASSTQEATTRNTNLANEPEYDLETKRLRNRYLTWAQDLISKGEYELAVYRVEAGLQELPTDPKLLQLRTDARLGLANQLANQKQYAEAIQGLELLQQNDNPKIAEKLAYLQQKHISAQQEAKRIDELDLKFGKQLQDIENYYKENKFSEAQTIVQDMLSAEGLDLFPQAKQLTINWGKQIEQAKVDLAEQVKLTQLQQQQSLHDAQTQYSSCIQAEQAGNLSSALRACQLALSYGNDFPEKDAAIAKVKNLQANLQGKANTYYQSGLLCQQQNDTSCAIRNWHYALTLDPQHVKANAGLEAVLPVQVKKAQALYREGLVYEGLNNRPEAISRWNTVLNILPVEDQLYHQKALVKLREHGVR